MPKDCRSPSKWLEVKVQLHQQLKTKSSELQKQVPPWMVAKLPKRSVKAFLDQQSCLTNSFAEGKRIGLLPALASSCGRFLNFGGRSYRHGCGFIDQKLKKNLFGKCVNPRNHAFRLRPSSFLILLLHLLLEN